jgi:hypothetical protein
MPTKAVAISWYRQDDYAKIRDIMDDSITLPETYGQWLEGAKKAIAQLIAAGYTVEKAPIDSETFPGWCRIRGLDVGAKARIRFAKEIVSKKHAHQT